MVITLNGKKHTIADCWENLKTRHYQRIMSEWDQDKKLQDRNYFKLFCILTDTEFSSFKATHENETAIWNCVRWIIEQPSNFDEVPKVLVIGEKVIDVPKKVELLSIGQNIHLRTELEGLPCVQSGVSIATAIFLQPIYDSYQEVINKAVGTGFEKTSVTRYAQFDIDKAKELQVIIDEMPITLTYPIGFFLLQNALRTGTTGVKRFSQIKNSLTSMLNRMLQRWRSLKSSPRLMT